MQAGEASSEYTRQVLAPLVEDQDVASVERKPLKLSDFPHLVQMAEDIKSLRYGTTEYWKQRCINREAMDDPTYTDFERSNRRFFHSILVKKERDGGVKVHENLFKIHADWEDGLREQEDIELMMKISQTTDRPFFVDTVRGVLKQLDKEEISFSLFPAQFIYWY